MAAMIKESIQSSLDIDSLPLVQQKRVYALKNLNDQYEDMMEQYERDQLALRAQFRAKCEPLFSKRRSIVMGAYEPTETEYTHPDFGKSAPPAPGPDDNKPGIPNFWFAAMQNHDAVSDLLHEQDAEALSYLVDIRCEYPADDLYSFKLVFEFAPNPFFTNQLLTKEYVVLPEMLSGTESVQEIAGSEIEWKPGQDLTHEIVEKKQTRKGKNGKKQTRVVEQKVPCESFFRFFEPPKLSEEGMGEDDQEMYNQNCEDDVYAGRCFRDRVIPDAFGWFTGAYFDFDEDGEDEDDDDVNIKVPNASGEECKKGQQ
jgi:nucleosome assembly protein 1-like 1